MDRLLKLFHPQITKEVHVHCRELENTTLCWQPPLTLRCFIQVFCLLACLVCYFISWCSVHHHNMYFPHVTVLHTSSNLPVIDGWKVFKRPASWSAPSEYPHGQKPVTLCRFTTTVGLREPLLCTATGSWKRAMFIKSKTKPILSEPPRNRGGQPSGWHGCDPKIIQREGEIFVSLVFLLCWF